MLTENDLRALRQHNSLLGKAVEWVVLLLPIVLIVLANMNLKFAVGLGGDVGHNLDRMISDWLNGVDGDGCYPGTYIIAVDLLKTGVMQLVGALALAVIAWSYLTTTRMYDRVLDVLQEKEQPKE